jgi:hypothetical protein
MEFQPGRAFHPTSLREAALSRKREKDSPNESYALSMPLLPFGRRKSVAAWELLARRWVVLVIAQREGRSKTRRG